MTIIKRLDETLDAFRDRTGRRAEVIELGRYELAELREVLGTLGVYFNGRGDGSECYMGVQLFRVDAPSHFRVGSAT